MCPGPAAPANNASGFVNARISVPRDGWTPSPPVRASAAPPIPSCAHPRPRYGVRAASWTRPGNWPGPLRISLERPIAVDAVPHCRPGACRALASCHPTMTAMPYSPPHPRPFPVALASPVPHGRRVAVLSPRSAVPAPTARLAFLLRIRGLFKLRSAPPVPLVAGLLRSPSVRVGPPCRRDGVDHAHHPAPCWHF